MQLEETRVDHCAPKQSMTSLQQGPAVVPTALRKGEQQPPTQGHRYFDNSQVHTYSARYPRGLGLITCPSRRAGTAIEKDRMLLELRTRGRDIWLRGDMMTV